jgi:hypothetical protein
MAKKRGQSGTLPFLPILAHSFLQNPAALLHCFWPRPPSTPQAAGGPFAVTQPLTGASPPESETQVIPRPPYILVVRVFWQRNASTFLGFRVPTSTTAVASTSPSPRLSSCARLPHDGIVHHPQLVSFPYAELDETTRSGAKSNPFHQNTKHMYKMKC